MAYKTIILKGTPKQEDYKVGEASMYPGMLVYESAAGVASLHAVSGGNAAAMFLIEDALQGKEIGTVFTADQRCQVAHCQPGDEVNAWLADGESVSIGDYLISDGNGDLLEHTVSRDFGSDNTGNIYEKAVVGQALEAVNLAASSNSTHGRIKIRIV